MTKSLKMGYITKGSSEQTKNIKLQLFVYLVLGVTCLSVALCTVLVDPIRIISVYYARVGPGTLLDVALKKETDSIHLSAYLFNITNADRFASGEDDKLKMEEVGPFTYQENRTNDDMEIDLDAGVVRYTPRHRVTFLPEESVGRPEDMVLTMPNIAMLSMASGVSTYGYFAKMAFNMLAARLGSEPTVNITAHDYLWGYNEPLISLGNSILPGWINFDTLGVLDRLYDEKAPLRVEVSAHNDDKFMIKSVNGVSGLPNWGYPDTRSSCNSFNNSYEGIIYPPDMSAERPLKIYRNVLCRFMELEYVEDKITDYGATGMCFQITNNSYSKIPENECLCAKGICHDGISDLSPCFYGLPVVLSNAHFLDSNPLLYDRIEGMKPDREQHGSEFMIDPIIGLVMATKFSVQVNVLLRDVSFNSKLTKYSDMFVPIVNIKIVQPKLADDQIATLRLMHVYAPYILLGVQLTLVLSGLLLLAHSARILYWNWISSRRKGLGFTCERINVKETLSTEPLMNIIR
ncbi:scavenger receptor class B member 1-like [Spodoptera litura]|uniref:Scavenger receptor class B member 1-like n=1 Tax=Spodoptera litura TaxID=69820 RepID=A0A9J7EDK7_SPOLT|nr:scavenger receptor class B member 1-like [Spodoptera litura]